MVWMRTAGQGKLKKLWGRIHQGLPAGDYYLIINNSNQLILLKLTIRSSIVMT